MEQKGAAAASGDAMKGLSTWAMSSLRSLFAPPAPVAAAEAAATMAATLSPAGALSALLTAGRARTVVDAALAPWWRAAVDDEIAATPAEDAAAAVGVALGVALGGARVWAVVRDDAAGVWLGGVAEAARLRMPLVVLAWAEDDDDAATTLRQLQASGVVAGALAPGGGLGSARAVLARGLLAQRVAEQGQRPVVLVGIRATLGAAPEPLAVPTAASWARLLGAADDDVAATAAVDAVFAWRDGDAGPTRRRVPRRWDLDRPVALGMRLAGGDRAAARASRAALAEGDASALIRQLAAALASELGQPIDADGLQAPAPAVTSGGVRPMAPSALPHRQVLRERVQRVATAAVGGAAAPVAATASGTSQEVPAIVRRWQRDAGGDASLSRLWGEVVQPRACGEGVGELEPWLATVATPAAAAALADRRADGGRDDGPGIATVRLDACTGCGACWRDGPDAGLVAALLTTEAVLDAAAERAFAGLGADPQRDKLRRSHKTWAGRLDAAWVAAGARVATAEAVVAALEELLPKLAPAESDRELLRALGARVAEEVAAMPLALTPALHHAAHQAQRGAGRVLALAVDPRAEVDGALAAARCPEAAICVVAADVATLAAARRAYAALEALPDTSAETAAAATATLGPAAAALLSRHAQHALVGPDLAAAGDGRRLALRLVAAAAERAGQRRVGEQLRAIEAERARLRDAIRAVVADSLPVEDAQALRAAAGAGRGAAEAASALLQRLDDYGVRARIDAALLARRAAALEGLDHLHEALSAGPTGLGRARYGVVIASEGLAQALGTWPRNPFVVPALITAGPHGLAVARGLAEAQASGAVAFARGLRRATLAQTKGAEAAERDISLDALAVADLDASERAHIAPLLVLTDAATVARAPAGAVPALLTGGGRVVVVVVDGLVEGDAAIDAAMAALARCDVTTASCALSAPDQLWQAAEAAMASAGPTLLCVATPTAASGAVAAAQILDVAAQAVATRLRPLWLRPAQDAAAALGPTIDLSGNPAPDARWASDEAGQPQTPASLPAPFRPASVAAVAGRWALLQELAGACQPFAQGQRDAATAEAEARFAAASAAQQAAHQQALEAQRAALQAESIVRLRDGLRRLLAQAPSQAADDADGGTARGLPAVGSAVPAGRPA